MKKRVNKSKLAILMVVIAIVILVVFNGSDSSVKKKESKVEKIEFKTLDLTSKGVSSFIKIPAIDNEGNSIVTILNVNVEPGNGKTLVDIDSLLFWVDTQSSIRTAKNVAAEVANVDLTNLDVTYKVYANASLVGGPSAGTAIAIATISALEKREIRDDVMITGAINHDGTIGPVGEIIEKAQSAKDNGAILFLVPLLQSSEVVYETNKHCEKFGLAEFCNIEQVPKKIDVSEEVGIKVVEVRDIEEAMNYFYK